MFFRETAMRVKTRRRLREKDGGERAMWRDRGTARHVPIIRNDRKKNIRVRENLRVYTK